MARKKRSTPHTPQELANLELGKWKKGQSGNPKGCPPSPFKHLREKYSASDIKRIINHLLSMSKEELVVFSKDASQPAVMHLIASIIAHGIIEGDQGRLNAVLDRTIGKVSEKVEHKLPQPTIIHRFESGEQTIVGSDTILLEKGKDFDED